MNKSIISDIADYWFIYVTIAVVIFLTTLVVIATNEGERRVGVCLERGMILVDTPAGAYCAAISSLKRI
jgi:hypothetical protein